MYEDEKKEPVIIYGKKPGQQTAQAPGPEYKAPIEQKEGTEQEQTQTQTTQAPQEQGKPTVDTSMPDIPTASVSAKDPYEDYLNDLRKQHASSLAEIRRRRRELDEKYQSSEDRQKRVMKIMAIGKLVGALAQFAGGARAGVAKDDDPYQLHAWKQLNQTRAEHKEYGKALDSEEKALNKTMQDALNKAQMKRAESVNKRTEQLEKFQTSLYLKAYDRETKVRLQELKNWYDRQMFNAKTDWEREKLQKQYAYNLSLIEARLDASLARQDNAAQNDITKKELGAEIAANTPTSDQRNATSPDDMAANRGKAVDAARNKVGGGQNPKGKVRSNPKNKKSNEPDMAS